MLNEINLNRTDLNLLVLFQAVMDEAHVGRAARRLRLTSSAVSHGLNRLRRLFNDPLFLRTPKGVVPTERATLLAGPVADILTRVGHLVATADPFDPARSRRTFTIGAPDAVTAVILPALMSSLSEAAPNVDIRARQLLPVSGTTRSADAWAHAMSDLDERTLDIAIVPVAAIPARFASLVLYNEDFVIVSRTTHPYARSLGLEAFCAAKHLLISQKGDGVGLVDHILAERGLSRRIVLTVPNFMMAFTVIAQNDLIAAIPRQLAMSQVKRFGLTITEAPMRIRSEPLRAVASKAAMMDAGVAWLFGLLNDTKPITQSKHAASAQKRSARRNRAES
jgi:DNA-binding transcriptional LysR family regulator